jgi:PAS domain S-box-containing protein
LKKENTILPSSKIYEDAKVLSSIGQKIIACLSINEIISTVYEEVNKVMVATSMNLGVFNSENNRLEFPGTMEMGEMLEFHWATLDETFKMPVVCYTKEQEILINDIASETEKYTGQAPVTLTDNGKIPNALIYIPLYSKKKILAVISVQSFDKNTYTEYHVDLLKNIGNYIGIAIENARTYENLEKQVKERTKEVEQRKNEIEKTYQDVKLLNEIGQKITSCLSVEEIIDETYDQINKIMDANTFTIGLLDEKKHCLTFHGIEEGAHLPNFSTKLNLKKPATECFNNKIEVIVLDNNPDSKSKKQIGALKGKVQLSFVYFPLIVNDNCIGVISVQSSKPNAYKPYQLEMLRNISVFSAIALENANSFESITTLSEIGNEISSSLDLEFVLSYLYKKVNDIMDAPIFMATSYSEKTKVQAYEFCMENHERILQGHQKKLISERDSLASWVAHNKKEIIINDLLKEYKTYIDTPTAPYGDLPESLIYIPLIVEGSVIGILSVQSLKKNAYSKHHVELLRSLASYVSGAFNNAIIFKELEAARQEMEQLSIVASETVNAVIIMDEKGGFEWVNKAYTKMSGYTLKTLIKECGSNFGKINNEITRKHFDKMLSTKKAVIYELTYLRRDRSRIWIHTSLSPVLDSNNKITKIVAIDTDITDRKKAELKIQKKNKDITDSINYASRIQRAMLPNIDAMKEILPNSFVLYKPRDIVSGDFYWMTKTKDGDTIVSVVDCTGHGVPGAFLTIVGNNLLNQIVNVNHITSPSEILQLMNGEMLKRFEASSGGSMKDGMDMSICKINSENTKIEFAGAFSSLYHIRNNNLTEIGGSQCTVGTLIKNNPVYELHTISITQGDSIFLSTDGYQDQFGGPRFKKFKKTNFNKTLQATSKLPILDQRNALNDIIEEWRGKYPQVDDILVLGIAF